MSTMKVRSLLQSPTNPVEMIYTGWFIDYYAEKGIIDKQSALVLRYQIQTKL